MDDGNKVDQLWFEMQSGAISMEESVSTIAADTIIAGTFFDYHLELFDAWKNPVTLQDSRYADQTIEFFYTGASDVNTKVTVSLESTA